MYNNSTISTAKASAGISVIRISGEQSIAIADSVFKAKNKKKLSEMKGYTCALGEVFSRGEKLDECIATVFSAPHSYTGENVVELSCHGGVFLTAQVLRAVLDAGAVPAEAGEFTKRAFLNGKLDLIEAESVMDLISSRSLASARAALSVKDGDLSKRINAVKQALTDMAAHLNAWADYPEEDIPEVEAGALLAALLNAQRKLKEILAGYDNGRLLKEGVDTVIAGKPNVGKSTLMNLLAGYEKSIVTEIAGTTRDVVEENVNLDDLILNLSDTAGIRETGDLIEQIGVDKAQKKARAASLLLCVFDASQPLTAEDEKVTAMVSEIPAVAILNKWDLPHRIDEAALTSRFDRVVTMSAKHAEGVKTLIEAIRSVCMKNDVSGATVLNYNERQRRLTAKAADHVSEAIEALQRGMTFDAVTVSIEEALTFLCELSGERVSDAVIDQVFHRFCVGK